MATKKKAKTDAPVDPAPGAAPTQQQGSEAQAQAADANGADGGLPAAAAAAEAGEPDAGGAAGIGEGAAQPVVAAENGDDSGVSGNVVKGDGDGQEAATGDHADQEPAAPGAGDPDVQYAPVATIRSWPPPGTDAATLAAYCAGRCAGGAGDPDVSSTWLRRDGDGMDTIEAAIAGAAFLRANPDAPPAACVIHLRRNGYPLTPDAAGAALVAWKVFALTLRDLDALAEAARLERAAAERRATPAYGSTHGGAFEVRAGGPFDAAGPRLA